jgi:hypothetical protein
MFATTKSKNFLDFRNHRLSYHMFIKVKWYLWSRLEYKFAMFHDLDCFDERF